MSKDQLIFQRLTLPVSNSVQSVEGCCEFAGGQVYAGSSGHKCRVDKTYCPMSIYADSSVFVRCFLRVQELARQKREKF